MEETAMIKSEVKHRSIYILGMISVVVLSLAYQVRTPFHIALGEQGDEPYLRGFYDMESVDGLSYRWSSDRSTIFLPGIGGYAPTLLQLRLNGSRPPGLPSPSVTLRVNGRELTSFTTTDHFETYQLVVDRDVVGISGNLYVEINSEVFVPAEAGGADDRRRLGVLVDSVSAEFMGRLVPVVMPPLPQFFYLTLTVVASYLVARLVGWSRTTSLATGGLVLVALSLSVILYRLVMGRYSFWLGAGSVLANAVTATAFFVRRLSTRQEGRLYRAVTEHRFPLAVALLFTTVLLSHWGSRICCFAGDSVWSIPTAMSIIREGNTNVDEYEEIVVRNEYYGDMVVRNDNHYTIENIGGHIYTKQPVGASVVAVPFLFLMDKTSGWPLSLPLDEHIRCGGSGELERFVASFVVGLTAVFICLTARVFLDDKYSLVLGLIFAFCASSWSTSSRALWQHGPSALMLAVALYLILSAKRRPWLIQFASIPLAFSFVVRPTNSISVVLLTVFVLVEYRNYFIRYLLWALTVAVPFFVFNVVVYQSFLSTYYLPQKLASNAHFSEALVGNLVSPGRGLFVFSPVLLFCAYGIALKVRRNKLQWIDCTLLAIIFLHWFTISSFSKWWAGHSFGPRFFTDVIPYFMYFLIPVAARVPELKGARKAALVCTLSCSVLISFLIHYRGATDWDVHVWNEEPVGVDENPARIWDWRDIQFLRGIGPLEPPDRAIGGSAEWFFGVGSPSSAFTGLVKPHLLSREWQLLSSRRDPPGRATSTAEGVDSPVAGRRELVVGC